LLLFRITTHFIFSNCILKNKFIYREMDVPFCISIFIAICFKIAIKTIGPISEISYHYYTKMNYVTYKFPRVFTFHQDSDKSHTHALTQTHTDRQMHAARWLLKLCHYVGIQAITLWRGNSVEWDGGLEGWNGMVLR